MIPDINKTANELLKLINIVETLRSPKGCPWDRKQTLSSLKPYLPEETYELLDALDNKDTKDTCDELGDLLLQIVFITQIHNEKDQFDMFSVIKAINQKMIRRHPHVFAQEELNDHHQRWEQIKEEERASRGKTNKLSDRIPNNLPALKKATKVIKNETNRTPLAIVENLLAEMTDLKKRLTKSPSQENSFDNCLTNMLYSCVQLCTSLQLDAEEILRIKTKQVITAIDNQI